MNSSKDLHFKVIFADGSHWCDWFKRKDRWSERLQDFVPTTKFRNDFMAGPDEMSAKEIKAAFAQWLLGNSNKAGTFTVSYHYE